MIKSMAQSYFRETQNATGFDGYVGSNWCPNNLDEQIFIEMYNDAVATGKEVGITFFSKYLQIFLFITEFRELRFS